MPDIEGGDHAPPPQDGTHGGLLGSLLARRHHAQAAQQHAPAAQQARAAAGGGSLAQSLLHPFKRFSAVPEERSTHVLPRGSAPASASGGAASSGDLGTASRQPLLPDTSSCPERRTSSQSSATAAADGLASDSQPRAAGRRSAGGLGRSAEPLQLRYGGASIAGSSTGSGGGGGRATPLPSSSSAPADGRGVASVSAGSSGGGSGKPAGARAMGDVIIGRSSMAVKVSEDAAKKYMHMVPEEEIEEQVASARVMWSGGIHPLDRRYRAWWYLTVLAAALTGWLVTFQLAFMNPELSTPMSGFDVLETILLAVFCADIIVSFSLGYYDHQGLLVMDAASVAKHYMRSRLWLDLLTTLPWDWVVSHAMGLGGETVLGRYVALLGLLKLGRMYRVVILFYNLSYNLNVGLLSLTLMRNLTFSFYLLHWAACGFWYIALQEGPSSSKPTWVTKEADMLTGSSKLELYIFSFYWALVTFATLGYGDVTPTTTAEVVYTIVYVAINIVVWAYILGTITLLVTKQDEETGAYRQRMAALNTYCTANNLPRDLKATMAGLLRLHMSLQNEALGDEQVLAVFPTTIRRKILRQLYSAPLTRCYLFEGAGVKFLDALMLGARVELFLPKVEIVSALDHVNELYIVVAGHVELVEPSSFAAAAAEADGGHAREASLVAGMDAGDAFTAGMLSTQQLQSAAGFGAPAQQQPPQQHHHQQHHQQQQPQHPRAVNGAGVAQQPGGGGAAGGVSGALAGAGRRVARWLTDTRGDSYRLQQEQLQQDKRDMAQVPVIALARASRALAQTSGGSMSGGGAPGALHMPASAMRHLDSRSRVPLQQASVSSSDKGGPSEQALVHPAAAVHGSSPGSSNRMLGPGDCFAEVAYFTEVPKAEAVRSLTVCRILVIPRSTYNAVARDFPLSARQVLENLKNRAAELVAEFLPADLARELLKQADLQISVGGAPPSPPPSRSAGGGDTPRAGGHPQQQPPSPAASAGQDGSAHGGQQARPSPFSDPHASAAAAAAAAAPGSPTAAAADADGPGGAGLPLQGAPPRLQQQQLDRSTSEPPAQSVVAAAAAAGAPRSRPERPLLSTMSLQLASRYAGTSGGGRGPGSPLASRSSEAGSGSPSFAAGVGRGSASPRVSGGLRPQQPPLRATSLGLGASGGGAAATGRDARQARALARFTSMSFGRRHAASGGGAEPLATSASADACALAAAGLGPAPPQQQQQQQQHSRGPQRLLGTTSFAGYRAGDNTSVARAIEGMSSAQPPAAAHAPGPQQPGAGPAPGGQQQQQQRPQQQQQQQLGTSSALATSSSDSGSGQTGKQQRRLPALTLHALRTGETSRLYSDAEVQAVAASVSAHLSLPQQRLLADLLRLRQLVNKAAAKFDQMRLTAFLDACASGDVDVVQDMLRQGMSPNTADYDGRTGLMLAAFRGHKDAVLALLFAGADTRAKDARGFDALVEAARGGHAAVIDLLTRSGARAGISSVLQAQLLCKATYEGKLDRLAAYLRAGCDPDAHDYDGQTALHVAATEGNLPAARVLVGAGGCITLKDRWGYSPLDLAHKVGAVPLVEYLSSHLPPDVAAAAAEGWNRERTEAALAAARYGDTAALSRLLARGCPVDAADYDGRSLLHVAVTNQQQDVVSMLLAAGANPNARTSAGSSPLLEAAMACSSDILADLMAAGARLCLPPTEEAALLSSVLHSKRHDQLLALLMAGADPSAADYDSRTPLHIAASLGDVAALALMADALADERVERLTAVHWAATDRWGDTPLQEAERAGHADAAAFLRDVVAAAPRDPGATS